MKFALHAGRERRERDIHAVIEKLKFLPLDSQFEVYVRSWREPALNQRAYYRVLLRTLVSELADHIEVGGWDEDDFHRYFKDAHGITTTKDLDVAGWSAYIDFVLRQSAILWGVNLPEAE